jgi:uncharacterized protein (DUF1330 family)
MVHSIDHHSRACDYMAILPMENSYAETAEGVFASHGGRTHARTGATKTFVGKSD